MDFIQKLLLSLHSLRAINIAFLEMAGPLQLSFPGIGLLFLSITTCARTSTFDNDFPFNVRGVDPTKLQAYCTEWLGRDPVLKVAPNLKQVAVSTKSSWIQRRTTGYTGQTFDYPWLKTVEALEIVDLGGWAALQLSSSFKVYLIRSCFFDILLTIQTGRK